VATLPPKEADKVMRAWLAHLGEATVEVLGIDMSTWAANSENSDY
jgi:hypothetical protein